MYVSECFWPKDLSFDRSREKSQIVKSALRCFPIVLRLGTTPTTGAADNPLNIYPDISSAVAAAHLSNLSIINIIITIIIAIANILEGQSWAFGCFCPRGVFSTMNCLLTFLDFLSDGFVYLNLSFVENYQISKFTMLVKQSMINNYQIPLIVIARQPKFQRLWALVSNVISVSRVNSVNSLKRLKHP